MSTVYYSADDEHGTQLATGLPTREAATEVCCRYFEEFPAAKSASIYASDGETMWTVHRLPSEVN